MGFLDGYKTYLMALAAFLIALGSTIQNYFGGKPLEVDILIDCFIALAVLFLRAATKKAT